MQWRMKERKTQRTEKAQNKYVYWLKINRASCKLNSGNSICREREKKVVKSMINTFHLVVNDLWYQSISLFTRSIDICRSFDFSFRSMITFMRIKLFQFFSRFVFNTIWLIKMKKNIWSVGKVHSQWLKQSGMHQMTLSDWYFSCCC